MNSLLKLPLRLLGVVLRGGIFLAKLKLPLRTSVNSHHNPSDIPDLARIHEGKRRCSCACDYVHELPANASYANKTILEIMDVNAEVEVSTSDASSKPRRHSSPLYCVHRVLGPYMHPDIRI